MATKRRALLNVMLLGDSGVGKTSIATQFVNRKFIERHKPTIGVDFYAKELEIDDRCVLAHIWDTAGDESLDSVGPAFYRGSDCCILVMDVTSRTSFQSLDAWKREFLERVASNDPDHFPFVVLGNKVDLENRLVTPAELQAWCHKNQRIPYFETSAKENSQLDQAFETVIRNALARELPTPIPLVSLDMSSQRNKSCCC